MIKAGILTGNIGYHRAGVANYVHHLVTDLKKMTDLTTIKYGSSNLYEETHSIVPFYPKLPFNTLIWSSAVALQSSKFNHLDLVHNPSQYPLPLPCHKRYLMTIHDITAITMPDYHTRYRTIYSRAFLRSNITRATHIVSDSESTKQDLINHLNINPEKISVIHLAADSNFHSSGNLEITKIRKKYSLLKPFILFVGTIEPRKNIPTLFSAFKELIRYYPEYELVIIGRNGWKFQETYLALSHLNLENSVRFLTYVPHEDLPVLYGASSLFVFPSWYEGFGLPPLEAMQCGVPVIVSDRGSLPEIVGPEGCMVPPDDSHSLMEAMEKYLTDINARESQIRYNLKRTTLFSWDRCAKETAQIYQQLVE